MRINALRRWALVVGCLGVAASCAPPTKKSGPTPYDLTVVPDCYTVELFTVAKIKEPAEGVPSDWRAYSGTWGKAGWEGKWCHDLHVLEISPEGEVVVMELHAPYDPWGRPATAFKRFGRITDDGRLRLSYSGVSIEYWLQNGRLYGLRKEGGGEMRIALSPGTNSGLGS